jgi:hypothetical protein
MAFFLEIKLKGSKHAFDKPFFFSFIFALQKGMKRNVQNNSKYYELHHPIQPLPDFSWQ